MKRHRQTNNGFTALVSSIIISSILLIIAVDVGFVSYYNSLNISDSESKEMSSSLADACLDLALLRLVQNPTYSGNETVLVSENSCLIGQIQASGSQKIFNIKGVYKNTHTNLNIIIDATSHTILTIEEILTI